MAEVKPASEGKAGVDIFGEPLPPPEPEVLPIRWGSGVAVSEDGCSVVAKTAGMPRLSPEGEVTVLPTRFIDGDIGIDTGHVRFDGHIEVTGAVENGYTVEGRSLRAYQINGGTLAIREDIFVEKGIHGADIRCSGNLKARHIRNSSGYVKGDIIIENEIGDSTIETRQRCVIKTGAIVAATVTARKGIKVMDVGTEVANPSELVVGVDHKLDIEVKKIKKYIRTAREKRKKLKKILSDLGERSDQVNTELGEIAQEQDAYARKQRELEERLEEARSQDDEELIHQAEQAVEQLHQRRSEIDEAVAGLMKEDEDIIEMKAGLAEDVADTEADEADLEERLETLLGSSKARAIPMVEVSGTIFAGNQVTGPHSSVTIREDRTRVRIMEKGTRRRSFEISRL